MSIWITISKIGVEELKNYIRIRGSKANRRKNGIMERVFVLSENSVKPIKTAMEPEANLQTENLAN